MPEYNQHRGFNYIIYIIIMFIGMLLYIYYGAYIPVASNTVGMVIILFTIGFWLGTDYMTPDLDINSAALRKWGFLRFIWLPYTWVWKHRGSSHRFVTGAIVRIIYFIAVVIVIGELLNIIADTGMRIPNITLQEALALLNVSSGIVVANAFHIILDTITTRGMYATGTKRYRTRND